MHHQSSGQWQAREDQIALDQEARERRELRCSQRLTEEDLSICPEEDDEDPPCECIQVDADEFNARYCPAHGPNSPADRRAREREAAAEFAYWSSPGWKEAFAEQDKQYDHMRITPASEVLPVKLEVA